MRIKENIALIENRILCNAIWGDTSCINPRPKFTGYLQANADKVGRAFIEYCIANVYGIYRLPQCGYDNYLSGNCKYDVLDTSEVIDACQEMEQVITHVQKMLHTDKRVIGGKASLVRCLAEFQMKEASKQLICEELNEIEIPVSIFSSYSYDGDIAQIYPTGQYEGKHINIKEDVSIEDIALWDCYVGNGQQECTYVRSMADCEREVWVVDRSINGIRKINRDKFYYTDGLPNLSSIARRRTEYGKDLPLHDGCIKKRPCEYEDWMTRLIINRNNERLKHEASELM